MSEIKDYSIEYRIRNNRLRERRLAKGLTQSELSKKAKVECPLISRLENFRSSPWKRKRARIGQGKRGGRETMEWKPAVKRLAKYFKTEPGELFPESIWLIDPDKTKGELKVNTDECMALIGGESLKALQSPEDQTLSRELINEMLLQIEGLRPKHRDVLMTRYGLGNYREHTLGEIGNKYGYSRERARQLIYEAEWMIRKGIKEKEENEEARIKWGFRPNA
jgi:transcriptional regulator with XRE-family HTH domain